MALASWVVKRQLMVVAASLRSASQALMFLCRASSSGFRLLRQARATTLNSISAMFSQLPCLGVWWNSIRLAMRRASAAEKQLS